MDQSPDYIAFQNPDESTAIRINRSIIGPLTAEVMRGFGVTRRRGTEAGGILLGFTQNGLITVEGFEAVPCEYAFGPSYVLSPNDLARFGEAVQNCRAAQDERLLPIGFWRSSTRETTSVEQTDRDLFQLHLPEGRLALLLKPFATRPPEGTFFFAQHGSLQERAGHGPVIFSVNAPASIPESASSAAAPPPQPEVREIPPRAPEAVPLPPLEPAPDIDVREALAPTSTRPQTSASRILDHVLGHRAGPQSDRQTALPSGGSDLDTTRLESASGPKRIAARALLAAALLCLGFVAGFQIAGGHIGLLPTPGWSRPDASAALNLGMTIESAGDLIRLSWAADSMPALLAESGRLQIEEAGATINQQLQPAELRGGTVLYRSSAGEVRFRLELTLPGGRAVTQTAAWHSR